MKGLRIAPSIVVLPLLVVTVRGEAPRTATEIAQITASDGIPSNFGASIAVSGDDVIVGAPAYAAPGQVGGAAYVFHRSGSRWVQTSRLTVEGGLEDDALGISVAIEGDFAVVGAPQIYQAVIGGGYGAVYIFRRTDPGTPNDPLDDTWSQDAKLTSPDAIRWGDQFGYSVSISGGTILVGRRGWEYSSGSGYVYRRVNNVWVHVSSLSPSDSTMGDAFGSAVSLSDSVAFVGASRRSEEGIPWGAAYIFRESAGAWSQEVKIMPGPSAGGYFPESVSVAGDCATAGAPYSRDLGPSSGSAYVFERSGVTWDGGTKLLGSDGFDNNLFGYAVSTDGRFVMVGAIAQGPGAAYLFERESAQWVEERKLVASAPVYNASLGASVAVHGNYAFAGAREKVYVYVLPSAAKNLHDFASFQTCFHQEEGGWTTECAGFDLVPDGRIDLRDFNEFLATFAGP